MSCEQLDFKELRSVFEPYNMVVVHEDCINERNWLTNRHNVISQNVRYNILDASNGTILGNHCCAEKSFFTYDGKKFVWIHNIRLKDDLKVKGLVRGFARNWNKKYIKEGFSGIALDAIRDGVVAWYRLGFNYKNSTDLTTITGYFADYLKEIKDIELDDIDLKTIDIEMFFDKKQNFTDWLSKERSIDKIPMIRRF